MKNWWKAQPWRVWPFFQTGWRYHRIYRAYRHGSKHPRTGHWLAGGQPRGRLKSLWGALSFPHVHDDEEGWPQ
jgi:hypothetical protein